MKVLGRSLLEFLCSFMTDDENTLAKAETYDYCYGFYSLKNLLSRLGDLMSATGLFRY
jgi:hypothetical protein